MKKILSTLVLTGVISGLLMACTTANEPSEMYRDESAQQIYAKGRASLLDNSYGEAAKRFEALDVQYPFEPVTENAQLYIIYAYYMKEDYALAVAAADHFIRMHPTNPNLDYAYYMRGLSNYFQNLGFIERMFAIDLAKRDLTQIQRSFYDFNTVVRQYPQSRYAPYAHQYLIYLRNVLARHELQVAEYYYTRKAYVAAANRASGVVANYQGAPSVVDALVLMVKSYRQLHMPKQEQDALTVLRYNYPNKQVVE